MNEHEFIKKLEGLGYKNVVHILGKGFCALYPFAFTVGLCVGLDEEGYDHRYCYPTEQSAMALLTLIYWQTLSDKKEKIPEHPMDEIWIKRKGREGDLTNPLYKQLKHEQL